ncbi:MAG: acyl-[acyl-carrier-protein]--UDP-N-acetylglucosamine O-acyltransferase [Candidatus Eisenbacteria bacterium RBG_16_71_46]|nr:MAG: acyl-[acyl-carrier-protein]--UDP-N-acetylglucosamine O-acyltransferase [Candidatus Eisenbacteria bacterium RBG_16_71_46]OGF21155.1 MAG: acyl-[acyl-carrier-protein]--UDP-N-acetylglucosamine O-acyltransferase [Candidatus Eisenbacteria bacterium RBG_19FT_COMBO_70_11]
MTAVIHPAAFVDEGAELGVGVSIEPGAVIGPHVRLGDRVRVGSHALLTGWTTIGHDVRIHHGAVLGSPPQDLKFGGGRSFLVVGDHTEVREYVTANLATEDGATTRVGAHCLLMAYVHIAHDCVLGDRVIVANASQFAGFVTVEDWAIVGGLTAVHQFVRIGCHAMVGGGSRIAQDVAPYVLTAGSPPRNSGINRIGLQRRGFSLATQEALERAYRILFREKLSVGEAVSRVRAELPGVPEVEHFARFAETSARGLTR